MKTLQARRDWQEVFKVMKSKALQPILLYPAKLSFRMEGQIKCFPGKVKPKEFNIPKPLLHEMLKGLTFFFSFYFILFYFILFFIVIQLQLYAFSPHPSTPPQLNPPPSPTSTLPLDFVHVSFIVVPIIPSPHCPLPTPP